MSDRTGRLPTPASSDVAEKLPPLPLAAAGLSALDSLVTVASVVLFAWDSAAATPFIQRAAPFLLLAGVAAVVVGGAILVKNKRSGVDMQGTVWAIPAVLSGLLLMCAAVFLPLIFALSMLIDESNLS